MLLWDIKSNKIKRISVDLERPKGKIKYGS